MKICKPGKTILYLQPINLKYMLSKTIVIKEPIICNFDVSVVMPFYKKMSEFREIFPRNHHYFERNGIEVVIVLDTPLEKDELLDFVKEYPFVNWRIILNDKPHGWRNPAKPLNVGLRFATKKYVMVCSPESEMLTDVIYLLLKTFDDYKDFPHYAIGRVCFADNESVTEDTFNNYHYIPFGSIMAEKKHLYDISGYDETFSEWGGDDNNLRSRLDMTGIEELYVSQAMMIHRDIDNTEGKVRRSKPFEKTPNDALRHYFFPQIPIANEKDWGSDFNTVIYDWKHNIFALDLLRKFAKANFPDFEIATASPLSEFHTIALVQSYNESERIKSFLSSISPLVDGIILIDDESEDDTYNLAINDKIIFKARKGRIGFNDLENRNLLLKIASFFSYTLACFIDVDEKFDERFNSIRELCDDNATAYLVPYIHLWDSESRYNAEYPGSDKGICLRYKIFRNIGCTSIISGKRLHFHQVPTRAVTKIAGNLLIKHYAFVNEADRKRKYDFYLSEDTEHCQSSYEHFSPYVHPQTFLVDDINQQTLNRLINQYTIFQK